MHWLKQTVKGEEKFAKNKNLRNSAERAQERQPRSYQRRKGLRKEQYCRREFQECDPKKIRKRKTK